MAGLVIVWVMLAISGCQCRDRGDIGQAAPAPEESGTPGEALRPSGRELSAAERSQAADLIALATAYYPVWEPGRESVNDYFERFYSAPETERLQLLIRQRMERDRDIWRIFLREMQQALRQASRHDIAVRDGNPPMFCIPSFQVILHDEHARGEVTLVFRLSMLAPFYDSYERIRDSVNHTVETSLSPTGETAALAEIARGVIAKHFPAYRELPPELGSVPVPNVLTIHPGVRTGADAAIAELTLAELLFEDTRRW